MAQTSIGAMKVVAAKAGLTFDDFKSRVDAGEKWCWACREWHPRNGFNRDASRYDGLSARCRSCTRVKERVSTKGRVSTFKGRHHTDEAKAKLSAANMGNKRRVGAKHTPETKARISEITRERTARGEAHYAFSHGRRQRALDDRRTPEYKAWRSSVFQRDGFRCTKCGDDKGGNLRAHHLKHFADHPELRFAVDNGVTLCHECHELEHYKPDSIRNMRKAKRGETLF